MDYRHGEWLIASAKWAGDANSDGNGAAEWVLPVPIPADFMRGKRVIIATWLPFPARPVITWSQLDLIFPDIAWCGRSA